MDCARIRDILLDGGFPGGPEVDAHLASCLPCRELVAGHGELARALGSVRVEPSEQPLSLASVEASLKAERGPRAWLRSRSTPVRAALLVWLLLFDLTLFVLVSRRPDWELYPELRLYLGFAVFGVGAFAAIQRALRGPLRPASSRRGELALAVLALLVPLVVALLPRAHAAHSASLAGTISDFGPRALGCFVTGLSAAGPLSLLLWLGSREPRPSLLTTLFVAVTAGFAANLVLHAHCAITDPGHLAFGHATVGGAWLLALLVARGLSRGG